MKNAKAINILIFVASFVATIPMAFSQDKAMIDSLVSKNLISQDEASKIAKDLALVFPQKDSAIKTKVGGFMQMMSNYMYSDTTFEGGEDWGGFSLRRAYMCLSAEIPENWKVVINLDFCRRNTSGSDYLLDCYISKKLDLDFTTGTLHFGFKKVQMGYEEVVGVYGIPTIDTSIVSRYFLYSQNSSRIGMGSRFMGFFWDGELQAIKGFKYHLALTNSINNTIMLHSHLSGKESNPMNANSVNFWAAFFYTKNIYEDFKLTIGTKTGFGNQAFIVSSDKFGSIFEVNPFVELRYKDKYICWLESIIANVEYGSLDRKSYATPIGYNFNSEYFFLDLNKYGKLSFVNRLSQVFTDGKGILPKDVLTGAKSTSHPLLINKYYDRATTIYAGLCWYIRGNDFKFFVGYEYAKFDNPIYPNVVGNIETNMHIFRTQIQLKF